MKKLPNTKSAWCGIKRMAKPGDMLLCVTSDHPFHSLLYPVLSTIENEHHILYKGDILVVIAIEPIRGIHAEAPRRKMRILYDTKMVTVHYKEIRKLLMYNHLEIVENA